METIAPHNPGTPTSPLSSSVSVCVADKAPVKPKSLFCQRRILPIRRLSPAPSDSSPSTASAHLDHGCAQRLRIPIVMVAALVMPRHPPSPRGREANRCVTHPRPDWLSGPRYLFRDGSLWSGSKPQHPREDTEPPALHSLVFIVPSLPFFGWPPPLLARRPS